ncbi:MAG: GspH/FimT family pseudopilin [Planctomycetota bacterium]
MLRRAFSLTELVIVLVVISVAAGLALPAYSSATGRYRAHGGAQQLVADLDRAAAHARTTATQVDVAFLSAPDRVEFSGLPDRLDAAVDHVLQLEGDPFSVRLVTADFGGSAAFTLNELGVPSSGGTIELDGGGRKWILDVDPTTGEASIR